MKTNWTVGDFSLNFRLGVRTLYKKGLQTLILENHLIYTPQITKSITLPTKDFNDKIEAVLLRSVPIDNVDIKLCSEQLMLRYFPWRYVRHYIDLTKSFEQYLNGMSYASRKSFKRRIRKFTEFSGGEIIWREYRGSHIEEFYSHAREISKKTYQELLLGEGLPATEEFRNNILELSLKDNVIGYLLYHKNHPIAYSYFHAEDEILFNAFGGYDPEYRQWSPGTILDLLIIEKLFTEKKFRVLDMGPGDFDYKRTLSTDHFLCTDILFLRKTLSNKFLMNTYFIWGSITKFGISVAEKLRVKTMLKRLNKQVVFPSNSIAIIITDYIEMFPFSIIASQI